MADAVASLRAEEKAATKIGAAHRGNNDRKIVADKQRGARRNAAAVEIQRKARGNSGREKFRNKKATVQQGSAAASMQAMERGRVARAKVAEARQDRAQTQAATMLQAKERGNADRRRVAEQKRAEDEAGAAVSLQAATRGRMGREDAEAVEIKADAEDFEKMMRRMSTAKRCAIRLQAALRGRVVRTRLRAADVRERQSQQQDGVKTQEDELEELLAKASDQLTRTTATAAQAQQRSAAPSPAPQQADGGGGSAAALGGEAGRLPTVAEVATQPAGEPSSAPLTAEQMVALDMRAGKLAARARDYQTARQSYLRAYEVGGRTDARIAAVDMALRLGRCDEAAGAYAHLLEEGGHAPPVARALQRGHAEALGLQAAARRGAGGGGGGASDALPWRVQLLPPPPDAPLWPEDDGSGGVRGGTRARIVPTSAGAAETSNANAAALSLAVAKMRPLLEPMVRSHGLDWADVVPALEGFESVDELKAAIDDPAALLERLKSSVAMAKRPPSPRAGGYKGHPHSHHHHSQHPGHHHHGSHYHHQHGSPRGTPRKGAHQHGTPRKGGHHHGTPRRHGGDEHGEKAGGGDGRSATHLGVDQIGSAQAEQQQQLADGDGAGTTALSHRPGDEPLFGAFSFCCVSRQKEKPTGNFTPVTTPFETPLLAQLLMRFGDARFRPGGAMAPTPWTLG